MLGSLRRGRSGEIFSGVKPDSDTLKRRRMKKGKGVEKIRVNYLTEFILTLVFTRMVRDFDRVESARS